MPSPATALHGTWSSPVSATAAAEGSVRFSEPRFDGDTLYWLEMRPTERGRTVLMCLDRDGVTREVTPPGFSVRSRVHEYGGGAYAVHAGTVYFVNAEDQNIYCIESGAAPEPLLDKSARPEYRFADLVIDRHHHRLLCVCEEHSGAGEPENYLAAVDIRGGIRPRVLVSGSSFYSSPRPSPDGTSLSWISWEHPFMPWDETRLSVAAVSEDGTVGSKQLVAGKARESIMEPSWSPDGVLYWCSDTTGWWNLYRRGPFAPENLCAQEAEFGRPPWTFGNRSYVFLSSDDLLCSVCSNGRWDLRRMHIDSGATETYALPFTEISGLTVSGQNAAFVGASPAELPSVVLLDIKTGEYSNIRRAGGFALSSEYISVPETFEFPAEGTLGHGFYYPPRNPEFQPPAGAIPPLLVRAHGGPTGAATATFSLSTQYWTTRGFAVLDVNYGGSTGYGKKYRERLDGNWGVIDTSDVIAAARSAVGLQLADPERIAITGGSAGGLTVLTALGQSEIFRAGASYYGVSDLVRIQEVPHKFESHYNFGLVGPFPEMRELYVQRSPVHHVDRIAGGVIFFQGADDPIVPPDQSRRMFEALRAAGRPAAYLEFSGEQHGFRQSQNIARALEAEFYFYSRIFGFTPADPIDPISLENLPGGEASRRPQGNAQ